MTRERVEQATYKLSVRLKVDDDEGLEALQFLSNALAESEMKEAKA